MPLFSQIVTLLYMLAVTILMIGDVCTVKPEENIFNYYTIATVLIQGSNLYIKLCVYHQTFNILSPSEDNNDKNFHVPSFSNTVSFAYEYLSTNVVPTASYVNMWFMHVATKQAPNMCTNLAMRSFHLAKVAKWLLGVGHLQHDEC